MIVAQELLGTYETARLQLKSNATHGLVSWGPRRRARYCQRRRRVSAETLASAEFVTVTNADCALYIYTSGTTGLPKAAKVSHQRLLTWSAWFAGMMDTGPAIASTIAFPCIAASGGVVATGAVLFNGGSVAIREKFSASRILGRCLAVRLHVVSIHRRALPLSGAQPGASARTNASAADVLRQRARAEVWTAFQERFRIPRIIEFYAATEGNVTMFNVEGASPAPSGAFPRFSHTAPNRPGEIRRESWRTGSDEQGFCTRCERDKLAKHWADF